jgi:dTDP-4-amino-4,6-dideoxygalactose transaminase
MNHKIPLNRPSFAGKELQNIKDVLKRGHLSGDGHYTKKCSSFLKKYFNVPAVLLTPSCTHALELAYLLLNVKENDEVILPSFTFPSTVNAFCLRGARPKFVDIRADTLNMDENQVADFISKKTKAICPVHYAGVPCQMDSLVQVSRQHGVPLLEDAAQAMGGRYRGQMLGTFGSLSAISFHETKNCSSGEGGALLVNKQEFVRRAEIIRQKGTDRSLFERGLKKKYSWVDIGSSYVPSELQSAFLLEQLKIEKKIRKKRKQCHLHYMSGLKNLQDGGKIRLPIIPDNCESSYHLFYILVENESVRTKLQAHLNRRGIMSVFHYYPLHLARMGGVYGYRKGDFPVTENLSQRLLRLPLYNTLSRHNQDKVIEGIEAFFSTIINH